MGVNAIEFETFEQQVLDLVGEFHTVNLSEARLREVVRSESSRADAAEAARDAAERAAAEARAGASAAAAGATHAAAALTKAQEDLAASRVQLELTERQRGLLEERCSELSIQLASVEREMHQLRGMQSSHINLQRQYQDLQERVRIATQEARSEFSNLEKELRRVERCASGGAEVRERARLAASAHARERQLAAAELSHTSKELQKAHIELARLNTVVNDLRRRLSEYENDIGLTKYKGNFMDDSDTIKELRASLEAERSGAKRLERSLASALANNAELAAKLRNADEKEKENQPGPTDSAQAGAETTNISALESFLAD